MVRISLFVIFCAIFYIARAVPLVPSRWLQLASMPNGGNATNVVHFALSLLELEETREIFAFGKPATVWENFFWKYSVDADNWTLLSQNITGNRWFQSGIMVDRQIINSNQTFNSTYERYFPFIFGGIRLSSINQQGVPQGAFNSDTLTFDLADASFSRAISTSGPTTSVPPNYSLNRMSAGLVQLNDSLLMFFGCEGNPNRNDTLLFNFTTNAWDRIFVNLNIPPRLINNCTNGTGLGNSSLGNDTSCQLVPDPNQRRQIIGRCGHSFGITPQRDRVISFGGHGGGLFLSDLWLFDVPTRTWNLLNPIGITPEGRCYAASAMKDDVFFIFGGDTSEPLAHKDDMWAYSLSFNRWVLISPPGAISGQIKPSQRSHASMVLLGDGLYLYGGQFVQADGANGFLTEMWGYGLGCVNNCSGNGVCDKFFCVCNDCFAGSDCSINICPPPANSTRFDPPPPVITEVEPPRETFAIGIILAIVGGILFILLLVGLFIGFITYKYRQFKKNKAMKQQQTSPSSEGQDAAELK